MTLPPAAAVITRRKLGGMRSAMDVSPVDGFVRGFLGPIAAGPLRRSDANIVNGCQPARKVLKQYCTCTTGLKSKVASRCALRGFALQPTDPALHKLTEFA